MSSPATTVTEDTEDGYSLATTVTENSINFPARKVSSNNESSNDTPDSQISDVTERSVNSYKSSSSNEDLDLIGQLTELSINNRSIDRVTDEQLIKDTTDLFNKLVLEENPVDTYNLKKEGISAEDTAAIYDVATLYYRINKTNEDDETNTDMASDATHMSSKLLEMARGLQHYIGLNELNSLETNDSSKFNVKMLQVLKKLNIEIQSRDDKFGEELRTILATSSNITDGYGESDEEPELVEGQQCDGTKEQMESIWGYNLTNKTQSLPFKCYLCGQEILHITKGKVKISSEMEHKKPCNVAFGKYPHYDSLKDHNLKKENEGGFTDNMSNLWNSFINDGNVLDARNNYKYMKELYKLINNNEFNKTKIDKRLEKVFDNFRNYIKEIETGTIDIDNEENGNNDTFNYCKSLITFWLYEFAYACRGCNRVKSGYDLNNNNDREIIRNIITNKVRPSTGKAKQQEHDHVKLMGHRLYEGTSDEEYMDIGVLVKHFQEFEKKAEDVFTEYTNISNAKDKLLQSDDVINDIKLLQIMKGIRRIIHYSKKIKYTEPILKKSTLKGGKRTRKKRITKKRGVKRCNKTQRHRKTKKK
tara:strand:- start:896 stop:2665 length:1770 start_codon:yes stop_codon:yes gene_type:complete